MDKLPSGIIPFMRDGQFPGISWIEMLIIDTFPIFSLGQTTFLTCSGVTKEKLTGFDHLSIPADLRLHLTSQKEHIIFDNTPTLGLLDSQEPAIVQLFSIIGQTFSKAEFFPTPAKTKTYGPSVIISPFKDDECTPLTRFCLDFFIHSVSTGQDQILKIPFGLNVRPASDQHGPLFGPYAFSDLQRRTPTARGLAFTMRMGYVEFGDELDCTYVHSPLRIYERRPKLH